MSAIFDIVLSLFFTAWFVCDVLQTDLARKSPARSMWVGLCLITGGTRKHGPKLHCNAHIHHRSLTAMVSSKAVSCIRTWTQSSAWSNDSTVS